MKIGNLFQAFRLSASGLAAQRARLNVVSANIANADVTRTAEGGPYRRRVVSLSAQPGPRRPSVFARLLESQRRMGVEVARTSERHLEQADLPTFAEPAGTVTASVGEDKQTPPRVEYAPGHPDADADGYVTYPNVEVLQEMVDLLAASRAYEANVTALNATKAMLKKALEI
jgi:flagellar basal-body rod protein FlgC